MLENRLELDLFSRVFNIGVCIFTSIAVVIPIATLVFFATSSNLDNYWDVYHSKYGSLEGAKSKFRQDQVIREEVFYPVVESLRIPLPHIKESLLFIEYNDRPDCISEKTSILLGLKDGTGDRFVNEGEKLYFDCKEQNQISFADHETPFSIEVMLNQEGGLDVACQTEYLGDAGEKIYESLSHFTIGKKHKKIYTDVQEGVLKDVASKLVEARCYVPDQLFSLYGGEQYKAFEDYYRIETTGDAGTSQLLVKEGDLLTYVNGKWLMSDGLATQDRPLAQIKSIDKKSCDIVIWCITGISSLQLTLPIVSEGQGIAAVKDTFSKIFPRTENSVICQLEGKSTVIRKGDWLLKRDGKWRILRDQNDLNEYLRYALKGELFIFDGIEKREDSSFFTGHYFNDERTQALKIDLLISGKKKKEMPKSKKRITPRVIPKESEGVS